MQALESWLLRRLAQAVEAGEAPADLLAELESEFRASQAKPPEQSHADAVRDIAVELQMPIEKVETRLGALEELPQLVRELLLRRIAERWPKAQRKAYRSREVLY